MKQKVMISAGSQAFEFEGEIMEFGQDYIILKAKHGDIFIERKYLVFIQFLDDEEIVPSRPAPVETPKAPKVDAAAKFISKRLKHDPVGEKLEERFELVPLSQLPDELTDEELEVAKNVYGAVHGLDNPVTKASSLKQALKTAMQNEDVDFSMGMSGGKYQNPAQTILGMKNANNKKS